MKQYASIKNQFPRELLFFRMGDFYELFFEDAVLASRELGLTLTQRNRKAQDETPMCGVPHHAAANYINRLLARDYRVALCEQMEDPSQAKGLVRREVVSVLTPGMVYDPDHIESHRTHWIVCCEDECLAAADVTSGDTFYLKGSKEQILEYLEVLPFVEQVGPPPSESTSGISAGYSSINKASSAWSQEDPRRSRSSVHPDLVSEDDSGLGEASQEKAARRLLSYVDRMMGRRPAHLLPFSKRDVQGGVFASHQALQQLEIFESWSGADGTLFNCLNQTKTAFGSRLLRSWLSSPLRQQKSIEERLERVERWIRRPSSLKTFRSVLSRIGDMERRLFKIQSRQGSAKDLLSLAASLAAAQEALALQAGGVLMPKPEWVELLKWSQEVQSALEESSELESFLFRKGYRPQMDELRELSQSAQRLLNDVEVREREATQISSLKVRYNQVFGYYIEITKTHLAKIPAHYLRKQTLANAERFTTPELQELEGKILSAQDQLQALEKEYLEQFKSSIFSKALDLKSLCAFMAEEDVLSTFAWLSMERAWTRPQFTSSELLLEQSRHPVLEMRLGPQFVPNSFSAQLGQIHLLTGPNMAGKSTWMRQVGNLVVMAQVGCFVPAMRALLPVFENVLTRVGAHDQLAKGHSTFMVEMTETAHVLNSLRPNSLVIIDEIGRGTSTYDGMSLAQALLEYFLEENKAVVFFATHYHELTRVLEGKACDTSHGKSSGPSSRLKNYHMEVVVRAESGKLEFTHRLRPGAAGKSYGIEVAERAGLPSKLVQRARGILHHLESSTNR